MSRIIRKPETVRRAGYCDMHLRRLEAAGKFPKRFLLDPDGGRAVGWLESEVEAWIETRAAARTSRRDVGAS